MVDVPKDIQQAEGSDVYPDEVSMRGYKPNQSVHVGQIKKAVSMLKKLRGRFF